jgi:hypothetical protein
MAKDINPADHSKETAFIVAGILLVLGAFLLWRYANYVIVVPAFLVYLAEYHGLALVHLLPSADNNMNWVAATLFHHDACQPECVPSGVDWANFVAISKDIGGRAYMFNIAILFAMALIVLFKMRGESFKRRFSLSGRERKNVFRFAGIRINSSIVKFLLKTFTLLTFTRGVLITEKSEWVRTGLSLMEYQASHWGVSSTAVSLDANNFSGKEFPARTPAEWLRDNSISVTEKLGLDETAARSAFEAQLGVAWTGLHTAGYYVKTLAVLAALGRRRYRGRDNMAGTIARLHAAGGDDVEKKCLELIEPLLKDERFCATINRVMGKHAYANTAMVAIFGWGGPLRSWGGGKSGIFASSSFLWLRSVDRTLWYALNNVGRRAFHIEGAGVVSHFFAERLAGQPLVDPYVESAMQGLGEYLRAHGITDLDKYFYVENDF